MSGLHITVFLSRDLPTCAHENDVKQYPVLARVQVKMCISQLLSLFHCTDYCHSEEKNIKSIFYQIMGRRPGMTLNICNVAIGMLSTKTKIKTVA